MRIAVTLLVLLALSATAAAQWDEFFWFYISGDGDFMDCPPVFTGGMDPGGDMSDGSWSVTVCDQGWPTDPVERFAFIWETFFAENYTIAEHPYWTGFFDMDHGQPEKNQFTFTDNSANSSLSGYCTIEYQVVDSNANGELDEGEFCEGSFSFLQVLMDEGTGVWDGWGGTGNAFGMYERACPSYHDVWVAGVYLWLREGWGY